jgi:alpha-D-ribose 1-methylphosphonate 5-triphosphate diphosphatase PhnM
MNYFTLDNSDNMIIDFVSSAIIKGISNNNQLTFQIKIAELIDNIDNKVKKHLNSFYKLNFLQKMTGKKFNSFMEKNLKSIIDKICLSLGKKYYFNVENYIIYFEKKLILSIAEFL